MSDILDRIDEAIEEAEGYVEWHGSADSASWTADGSHEVDTGGRYYGDDLPGRSNPWPGEAWQQILLDTLNRPLDREVFDPSWVRRISPEVTLRQLSRYQEQIDRMQRAEHAFNVTYGAIVDEAGRVSWQRLTEPDPAETLREVVVDWRHGPAPVRPIEAVLREVAAAEEDA